MHEIAAAAAALLLLGGCTRSVDSGRYGPLAIGATKEATLAELQRLDVRAIEPLPYPEIRLENPERADLDALSSSEGIVISVDDHLTTLHVEFRGDAVTSTWPNFGEYPFVPRFPYSPEALLARMQVKIFPPMNHAAVFDAIKSYRTTKKTIVVERFVVGYKKMRGTDVPPWAGEYRSLLMANDAWKFDGLKQQLWYPTRHSDVTLQFRDGKLIGIIHDPSVW